MEPLPPQAATHVPLPPPTATPLSGMGLAGTDGPDYRAVFTCARMAGGDSREE
jgi:hypothetical protein